MEDMPRPRPPNLHRETNRHGQIVWYVRISRGPRIRIKEAYGTPEFTAAYEEALAGRKPAAIGSAARGTIEWLWNLYRQAGAWTGLSLATRKQRENIMRNVLAKVGGEPLSRFTRSRIDKGVELRKKTPTQAKHFVTALRGMFTWAVDNKLTNIDPTHGIGFKKKNNAKSKSEGFPVWNEAEMAAYELRWPRGTRERVAFDVYQYTGLRRGDAAAVGKQHVKNGVIGIQTEKTGMWVYIPVHPELQKTLDAGPLGDLAFVSRMDGQRFVKESLGNFFREACDVAGVKKSAHGIRKAAATTAADNGATEAELEALFAWSGGQMAALYTRSANRKRLAAGASHKMTRTLAEPEAAKGGVRVPLKIANSDQ